MSLSFFQNHAWIHTQNSQFYIDEKGNKLTLLKCCKNLKPGIKLHYDNKNNMHQALFTCSERKFLDDKFLQNNAEYHIYTTLPTCRLCFSAIKYIMKHKNIKFFSSDLEHEGIESFSCKSKTLKHKDRNKILNKKLKEDLI